LRGILGMSRGQWSCHQWPAWVSCPSATVTTPTCQSNSQLILSSYYCINLSGTTTIELPFNYMGFFIGSRFPYDFPLVVISYNINYFFPLVMVWAQR
jgi:hypothetical protein